MRRVKPLEVGMPEAPSIVSDTAQPAPTQAPVINIEVVERYTDANVKANPNKIYVFGDNTQKKGTAGQAQIRGNKNAMGIATKFKPDTTEDSYFNDDTISENIGDINSDIEAIKTRLENNPTFTLVFPKDGLGTGLAKLKEKAPKTFAYLNQRLKEEFGFDNVSGSVSQAPVSAYNYNPSNVSEQKREEYKNYVLNKLGTPKIQKQQNSIEFTYPDVTITIGKDGAVSYSNMTQKIVDLSKNEPAYDIKFMICLNKLAEDIVQEMYVKLAKHENKERFYRNGVVYKGFIWIVLRNMYYDFEKSKHKLQKVDITEAIQLIDESDDDGNQAQDTKKVEIKKPTFTQTNFEHAIKLIGEGKEKEAYAYAGQFEIAEEFKAELKNALETYKATLKTN